ncbi:MAG: SPFH domain-containing protein [Bacilli bacterium]
MGKGPYADDKYQFKFNFINKIPPGVTLVSKNVFTGEVKHVQAGDKGISKVTKAVFANWFPWIQTKYVSSLSKTIDYKEFGYVTSDRVTLMVDIACEVRIVDAAKFEFVSATISEQLKTTINDVVRKVMISHSVSDVLNKNFDLYSLIKPRLDNFKNKYGLEIRSVELQNIKLPDGVKKSYEQKLTTKADADRIREIGEATAYAKKLDTDVDINKKRMESGIEIEQLQRLMEIVKDCSKEDLELLAKIAPAMLVDNGRHLFVQGQAVDASAKDTSSPKSK